MSSKQASSKTSSDQVVTRAHLTRRGRAVLAAGFTAALCAVVLGQRNVMQVGLLLIAIPLLALASTIRARHQLKCTRVITPARLHVGTSAQVAINISNTARRRGGTILAEEQLPYSLGGSQRFVLPGLEPEEERIIDYLVRPTMRGRHRLGPLFITSTDPFGMSEHRTSLTSVTELVVLPAITQLAPIALNSEGIGSGGSRLRQISSSGEDDITTREYRRGDDLRKVHWRSSARRGELMVRREEQPWREHVSLLLDRRRSSYPGGEPSSRLEWSIDLMASVTHHLAERGYSVQLAEAHPPGKVGSYHLGANMLGQTSPGTILDALAGTTLSGALQFRQAVQQLTKQQSGLIIAVLGNLEEEDPVELAQLMKPGTAGIALVACPVTRTTTGPVSGMDMPSYVSTPHRTSPLEHLSEENARRCQSLRTAGWNVTVAAPREAIGLTWGRLAFTTPLSADARLRSDPTLISHPKTRNLRLTEPT